MVAFRFGRVIFKILAAALLAGIILSVSAFLVSSLYLNQYNTNPNWHAYSKGEYITNQIHISSRSVVLSCSYNSTTVYLIPASSLQTVDRSNIGSIAVPHVPGNELSGPGWQSSLAGKGSVFTNITGDYYLIVFASYLPAFSYSIVISEQLSYEFILLLFSGIAIAIGAGISLLIYLAIAENVGSRTR